MKRITFFLPLLIVLLLCSCKSKEKKIKEIIDDSYFGLHNIKKMGEINKLTEDIFSLSVHSSSIEKYAEIDENSEYEIVRYIYKTDDGVYRIFYLIDYTNEKMIDKSSDFNEFFGPITFDILGREANELKGDNLMEILRY